MENTYLSPNILKKYGILFDPKLNLSQFGGLEVFIAFLKKGKFRKRFEAEFGYYRARTMLQFIISLVAGADSMLGIANAGKDPLIKRFIGNCVEEAQLSRDIKNFTRQEVEALHDFVMSLSILDFVQKTPHEEELVFDIDSTSIIKYGSQEGVEKGYVGGENPEDCYQYLFIRLHNQNTFLYGTIRGGSAHSQNDFCGYLNRFLPMLKKQWRTSWRGDTGYFNEEAFDLFSSNDSNFFIKAPMSKTRLTLAETSSDLVWSVEQDGVSYAERATLTSKGTKYREIFKRTKKEGGKQLSLLESVSYRYDCIATNHFTCDPSNAFNFYNGRAHIENNIKELKYDYHLGKIITEDFLANDVITQLTLLTYMLIQHFKQEVLPPNMSRQRLSTLRSHVFNIPGRILSMARTKLLRIQNVFKNQIFYEEIFSRLENLRSWVLMPPELKI